MKLLKSNILSIIKSGLDIVEMARSVSNYANCLNDRTLGLLMAAARRMATPQISFEELISEGWWLVVRYKEDPSYMWFDLIREMRKYINRGNRQREMFAFEERMLLRNNNSFEQWLRHRKFKLLR